MGAGFAGCLGLRAAPGRSLIYFLLEEEIERRPYSGTCGQLGLP
jgi:hypothetical protein